VLVYCGRKLKHPRVPSLFVDKKGRWLDKQTIKAGGSVSLAPR
jgi:hypothetical protein